MKSRSSLFFVILILFSLLSACTKNQSADHNKALSPEEILISRGKAAYMSNCIACHNSDPSKDGSMGPAVQNSSLELLQSRILSASYPESYTPKRQTKIMQAMPQVQNDIEAIYKFLNQ